MKHLLLAKKALKQIAILSIATFLTTQAFSQVTQNFDNSFPAGTAACWQTVQVPSSSCGTYTGGGSGGGSVGMRPAIPQSSTLGTSTTTGFSINTTNPIDGSGSLHLQDSTQVPYDDGTTYCTKDAETDTLTSTAYGNDGNTVSFSLRIDSLNLPYDDGQFSVSVIAGSFEQTYNYTAADAGIIIPISTTISGSNGGGTIKIVFYELNTVNGMLPDSTGSSASFSLDIDDFSTNANPDPNNACIKVLPVGLINFVAKHQSNGDLLTWQATDETNNTVYEIQHSTDGNNFVTIGQVNMQTNSNTINNYNWLNPSPSNGANYYRLQIVNQDGSFTYSTIQQVNSNGSANISVAPNPMESTLNINGLPAGQTNILKLYANNGQLVRSANATGQTTIDISDLSKGLYLLRITMQDGTTVSKKIEKN